jgi:RecB family exonuclease
MPSSYSHNSLKTFEQCPRRFKFHYVEKADMPSRVSADTYLGNAVHQALHRLYERVGDGVLWPLNDFLAFYDAEWEKPERREIEVPKEYMTVDNYIRNGRTMLQTYYQRYQPFQDGTLLGVEHDLSLAVPNSNFRIKGRIDRLWKRRDGVIEICDYKTGSNLPRGGKDPRFWFQMGLYHWLVKENFPQFSNIELVQYYLKLDETVPYRMNEDELDLLAERARNLILETIQAERIDAFPTKEGYWCDYCDYVTLCPAKRHQLILDAEAGKTDGAEKSTAESASQLAERFLKVDKQKKEIEAEHEALKQDLVQMARDLQSENLKATSGSVSVKLTREEKFPTKTKDIESYAAVSELVRRFQLDTCLTVDLHALTDLYRKERLPADQHDQFEKYVQVVEGARVTPRHKKRPDEPDGD